MTRGVPQEALSMNGDIAILLVLLGISIPLSGLMLEERPRSTATAQLVTCL